MPFEVLGKLSPGSGGGECSADGAGGFSALLDEWLELKSRILSPKAAKNLRYQAGPWKRVLGDIPVERIGTREILGLYAERDQEDRANSTINLDRKKLGEFFRWLRKLELFTGEDPLSIWPTKNPRKKKRQYLQISAEWEALILAHLRERFRRFMVFAISTGLRFGEISRIVWRWIDEEGVLSIPAEARKQCEDHRLPLPRRALDAIWPRGGPDCLVFPDLPSHCSVGKALKRAGRKAGYPDWKYISPHQLRRSWLGRLARAGVPREACKDLGGWAKESIMVSHYWTKIGDQEGRSYLERI